MSVFWPYNIKQRLSPVFQGQYNLPLFYAVYTSHMIPLSFQSLPLVHITHEDTVTSLRWILRACLCECVRARMWAEADVDIFQFTCCTCGDVAPPCAALACQGSRMCAERRIDTVRHLPHITCPHGRWRHRVERRIAAGHAPLVTFPPSARPVKGGGVNLSWRPRRWHERFRWGRWLGGGSGGSRGE